MAPAAVRAAQRALVRAGVTLQLGTAWSEHLAAGSDLVLWATGAEAHAWQRDAARRGGLAVSERGFIRIDPLLRSVSHPQVYAVGDCAEWASPLPKAGVYAVRMGPVLTRNLRAALGQGSAAAYVPQHRFLALLATGDGRAIASRGGFGTSGRWVWRWKDHIDRSFVRRFHLPAGVARRASTRGGRRWTRGRVGSQFNAPVAAAPGFTTCCASRGLRVSESAPVPRAGLAPAPPP